MTKRTVKGLKTSITIVTLVFALIHFISCSGSEEPTDPKQMEDESGLDIDLEWTTGGSISQSLMDVDLDFILKKGTTIVDESDNYYSYENFQLKDIYSDGTYTIEIIVASVSKTASYKVFISGIKSKEVKQYDGSLTASEKGSTIEFITITKVGSKYTLSR